MQELTRNNLPMWNKEMGHFRTYYENDREKYAYWFLKSSMVFCQKESWFLGKTEIGFVMNPEVEIRHKLKEKAKFLRKNGWKGHRIGSVPNIGRYRKNVRARKIHGMMKELKDNLSCLESYKSFNGLVRASRNEDLGFLTDYDGICHHNSQRGWKRTKKTKQWM